MKVRRADAYGNRLVSSAGETPFLLSCCAPMDCQLIDCGDGAVEIRYQPVALEPCSPCMIF